MAVPASESTPGNDLAGQRIAFLGKLAGMTRREACEMVRRRGAEICTDDTLPATLVVLGEGTANLDEALQKEPAAPRRLAEDVAAGTAELLGEAELWERLGLVDDAQGVQRLYTPAMLAELIGVPVGAVRRWHRSGTLVECRKVRRLPYFDFAEVAVARHLAALLHAGCSLRVIDRKLSELARRMPDVLRPLADTAVVVEGRRLFLRRGDDLAEPGGQLQIDFDKADEAEQQESVLSMDQHPLAGLEGSSDNTLSTFEEMQQDALQWEDQGELERAAETYRTLMVACGPSAEINFALGDLLYRMGDMSAARERFYAAIEIDEEYVEARANLGCVLVENNELELAVAAFRGALAYHPDYADVHYHLANSLDRLGHHAEAETHWRNFLALAPESPWAELARSRLGIEENVSSGTVVPAQ